MNTGSEADPSDQLEIQLFAGAASKVGCRRLIVPISLPTTVAQLRETVSTRYPVLGPLMAHSRWACNEDFVDDAFVLQAGHRVAMIPPVSGG